MIYRNKLYFQELTFTPYSGFITLENSDKQLIINELLKI